MINTESLKSDFLFPFFRLRKRKKRIVEYDLEYKVWSATASKVLSIHKIKVQPRVFPND